MLAVLLLTDITWVLVAKLAPRVDVFFLSLPLKVRVTLADLALAIGFLLPTLGDLYRSIGPRSLGLIGY